MTKTVAKHCGVPSLGRGMQVSTSLKCGRTARETAKNGRNLQSVYQDMPTQGRLVENLNVPRQALLEKIAPFIGDTVYSYVVDTVKHDMYKDRLQQEGTSPNFQGDMITLCACKHQMRTYPAFKSGEEVWVAGYTSSSHPSGQMLFYLMRVSQRFESHRELWFSDSVPVKAKQAKSANSNIFGDIYQPLSELGDPYSQESYLPPCKCHSHCEPGDWGRDIGYLDRYGRIPSLLVGDPEYSFLWDRPTIRSPFKPSRALPKVQLSQLFPLA